MEHLSAASFLGKLLALPANVILDWEVIARYKHSSLFDLVVSDEGKKFYNIDTRFQWNKTNILFFISAVLHQNKLECLPFYLLAYPEAVFLVMCDPSMNEL